MVDHRRGAVEAVAFARRTTSWPPINGRGALMGDEMAGRKLRVLNSAGMAGAMNEH